MCVQRSGGQRANYGSQFSPLCWSFLYLLSHPAGPPHLPPFSARAFVCLVPVEVRIGCLVSQNSCKLPCEFWELILGPPQEQQEVLFSCCHLSPRYVLIMCICVSMCGYVHEYLGVRGSDPLELELGHL